MRGSVHTRLFRLIPFVVQAAVLLAPQAASAQHLEAAGISDTAGVGFLRKLQAAVGHDDAAAAWELAKAGLRVDWPDSIERIETRAEFLTRYHAVFGPAIRAAILRQKPESLWANWEGVMIGNGEVWYGQIGSDTLALQTVNEPGYTGFFHRPLPPLDSTFVPTGHWWPVKIACPWICAERDPADSTAWWHAGLTFTRRLVALGTDTCRTPVIHRHQITGGAFLEEMRFAPHELDLNDSLVAEVDVDCPTDDIPPGQVIWVQDSTHIWIDVEGGDLLLSPDRRSSGSSGLLLPEGRRRKDGHLPI